MKEIYLNYSEDYLKLQVGTAQLLLARHMTNVAFNDVAEASVSHKPEATSTMWV